MLPLRPSSRSTPACWEPWMYSRAPPPFRSWSRSAWTLATAWTFTPEPDAEWVAPLAWSRDALEPRNAVNAWCRVRACPTARAAWLHRSLTGDRPCLILDTPRGFSAPRCDGTLDWEVCLARCWHDGHRGAVYVPGGHCLLVLACRLEELQPDVLFGDGAVAPFCYGHHPAVAFHLPDYARPFAGPEPDRV